MYALPGAYWHFKAGSPNCKDHTAALESTASLGLMLRKSNHLAQLQPVMSYAVVEHSMHAVPFPVQLTVNTFSHPQHIHILLLLLLLQARP